MMLSYTLFELSNVKRGFVVHVKFWIHVSLGDEIEALVRLVDLIKFTISPYVEIMIEIADDDPQKPPYTSLPSICQASTV